ncbi:MAG TPA: beta-L-arabinofuranosidase domain-containing protein [Sphingomicrobium sp.]
MTHSRRTFLTRSACACAASALPLPVNAAEQVGHGPAIFEFERKDVKLLDGPLLDQFEHQRALYMSLDTDALMKPFRVRAGLPAPGADMGGWYDNAPEDFHVGPPDWAHSNFHGFIPGHSFGQYVSGLSRGYAMTRDPAVKARVKELVDAYEPTISPRFFDDYNLPAYTFDKLLVGLMDAWHFAGIGQAKRVAAKMTQAALPYLPPRLISRHVSEGMPHKRAAQGWDESYTLAENLFLAWQRGMGEQYGALASRYLDYPDYLTPLSNGINALKGQHAYSHVNALSSAVQAYLTLGDEAHLRAALNGFRFLEQESYATGGWGPNETLIGIGGPEPLYESLTATHASFETPCGTYGHFKIARYLMRITGDARYGDSMERLLYNAMLGALPTQQDGRTFYYSDYNMAAEKGFHHDKWPCCSGTFIQLTSDYGISTYLRDSGTIYVNLYVPSQVIAAFGGEAVRISQRPLYPLAGTSSDFVISSRRPAHFAMRFRIPQWAGPATSLAVNGQRVDAAVVPGKFAEIARRWSDGDRVRINFDMALRLEPLNRAHPEMAALMSGPLVLFPVGDDAGQLSRSELLSAEREGDGWTIAASDRKVRLKSFAAIGDEHYRLYTRLRA